LVAWLVPIILLAVIILPQMIRILREYERGVIFRLGKLLGTKGPGLIFLIPIVGRMVKMDLRVVTIDVARQELMTRDNVPMTVDAVVYFRVIDPATAVVRVEKYLKATSLISQTTLRSVLGQAELDELLSQRDKINLRLQEIIDRQTDPWGIKVIAVEVRDVVLPDSAHCDSGRLQPSGCRVLSFTRIPIFAQHPCSAAGHLGQGGCSVEGLRDSPSSAVCVALQ
jgi:regulator of protease activity HflC (stomatin/prohibitin superfamily)